MKSIFHEKSIFQNSKRRSKINKTPQTTITPQLTQHATADDNTTANNNAIIAIVAFQEKYTTKSISPPQLHAAGMLTMSS